MRLALMLDVLPHNGAAITALAVVGLSHKEAYRLSFMLAVLTPWFANAVALVTAMVLYCASGIWAPPRMR